jgi:quercetin dioxygenase-like cupin family protein
MKMPALPMSITDWTQIAPSRHPGETGFALWRTQIFDDIRVRMVEYSPGYAADHWCSKGHVILCLSGALDIELGDGKQLRLEPGQSYQVGDGDPPHRSSTAIGAKLFIVD